MSARTILNPPVSLSSGNTSLSLSELSFSTAPANAQFSSIQTARIRNLNPTAFTQIDGGDIVELTYENYQYTNLDIGLDTTNIFAFGNVSATDDGYLLVNYVNPATATNGLAGYCNFTIAITNTSTTGVTPATILLYIFIAP